VVRTRSWLLLVGLAVLYAVTADYGRQSVDPEAAAAAAWHLGAHGTPWLEGLHLPNRWLVPGADGHIVSNRFPGIVLLAAPFYALLSWLGPDHLWLVPGGIAAAVIVAGAMTALYRALAPRHGIAALGAVLVLALATPTWSVSAAALWGHGPAQLAFALALLALSRRRTPAPWFALAVLTRPHLAVVGAVFAVDQLRRRDVRGARQSGLGVAGGLALYLLWNRFLYGHWTVSGGYSANHLDKSDHPLGGLLTLPLGILSPQRGLLLVSPFLLLLLPGLRRAWRSSPWWYRTAAVAGCVAYLVNVYLVRASGGSAFYGYRLPLESLVLATPLLLRSFEVWVAATPQRVRRFTALVALSAAIIAPGAVLFEPTAKEGGPWVTPALAVPLSWYSVPLVLALMALAAVVTYLVAGWLARQDAAEPDGEAVPGPLLLDPSPTRLP
jgi:hypothetical protein